MSIARYAATQNTVGSPRELEIRAFRYVNGLLATAADARGRAVALEKAHRLWSILLEDLLSPANGLPAALRGQIVSLGLWAQRESQARLGDGGSVEALMAVHRDMIEGLEAQGRQAVPQRGAPAAFAAASA